MILRPYQEQLRQGIHEAFKEKQSTLVVMCTGGGKTRVAAQIISDVAPKRTLWLVHTRELVFQAAREIKKFTGMECDIEMASMRADASLFGRAGVIVASRDTLISGSEKKRFENFDPNSVGLLVVDEAHHATADSYDDILGHFKKNIDLKILGLTATPNRKDESALGKIFESVAGTYDIQDAIQDGYLVTVRAISIRAGYLDYSHVRPTAGDLNGADLAAVMEAEEPVQKIAQATYEAMYGMEPDSLSEFPPSEWSSKTGGFPHKKTLVFCVRVHHAEMLTAVLNRIEPNCTQTVSAQTDHLLRKKFLDQYHNGTIKCMTNCGVLTEGFDEPGIEVIIMARPTKSKPLFTQMLGRATRTLPGTIDGLETAEQRKEAIARSAKPFATIYDFTGNSGKHKIIKTTDALGGNYEENEVQSAQDEMDELAKEGESADVLELLKQKRAEIARQREERLARENAARNKIVAKTKYQVAPINLFDVLDITPQRSHGWDMDKRLSEKQSALLAKQGIDASQLPYAGTENSPPLSSANCSRREG
jgi:superfamily II DNA or RNA helicase